MTRNTLVMDLFRAAPCLRSVEPVDPKAVDRRSEPLGDDLGQVVYARLSLLPTEKLLTYDSPSCHVVDLRGVNLI